MGRQLGQEAPQRELPEGTIYERDSEQEAPNGEGA